MFCLVKFLKMEMQRCMNSVCGVAEPGGGEWRKGWDLRSGKFAQLCEKCGMAYEQLIFCDLFHSKESGWRQCISCGKGLHCGCIASKSSVCLLDHGGVQCVSCMKNAGLSSTPSEVIHDVAPDAAPGVLALPAGNIKDENSNDLGTKLAGSAGDVQSSSAEKTDDDARNKGEIIRSGKQIEVNGQNSLFPAQRDSISESFGTNTKEQAALQMREVGMTTFSNGNQGRTSHSHKSQQNDRRDAATENVISNPHETRLSISLGTSNPSNTIEAGLSVGLSSMSLPPACVVLEAREENKGLPSFQHVQRAHHLLPVPPKMDNAVALEASKNMLSHIRVARPPGEGRGKNQLLPRYWPRITDQELRQISGDSNSTIVPLFEKVLSASDAGRIGRLVLPKACAEAYFPPISQPEGLPLKIQDVNGKEWHFQFRFWPNNNSRMYVLEGVTPCIQSLQLQAGDTVTFSRMDPEGKLIMGFRKAANSLQSQDTQASVTANTGLASDIFFSSLNGNLPIISGYSGLRQSMKGPEDLNMSSLSGYMNSADFDIWHKTDKHGAGMNEGFTLQQPSLLPDKKRSRTIGTKSKRLHMDNDEALDLKINWEEAQDLLLPNPNAKPTIVIIDNTEFEEYDEPPIFGKRTIFTAGMTGVQDQWIQCDECLKWRRIPVHVLPPSKWTCADNSWDRKRSLCSVPDELSVKDMQNLLQENAELKRRKVAINVKPNTPEPESAGLDALATAAVIGETVTHPAPSVATTTRHPRHRPGCSCIVCIQPPSGKGPKHDPSCMCNVCVTVKRRFKTLMMRKKKRQSELEEAEAQKKVAWTNKEETEGNNTLRAVQPIEPPQWENFGQLDLNSHPGRSEDRVSMMTLLQVANRPLETYLKQNGLTSLASDQQASSSSFTVAQDAAESEGRPPDESYMVPIARERESGAVEEGYCRVNEVNNDGAAA
ncbi:B3 domain-containing protein Os07g0679700-like isoform X2 [Dioscorea cayenensis subsp. rotundata]|uniref:B3 domain-containing protein Os07g0679700-like isoform X2 n=1 Tax=Dioscorea cayennensis subsp. rotundata TaxID=55577 RepID=A0AB40C9I4_DIOCR|nr:B3 domain-containing protein Os07g0679700-like isoform X2 [Dioscorea cayenensis subsp. rotundata]